jgi:hypothetical protein
MDIEAIRHQLDDERRTQLSGGTGVAQLPHVTRVSGEEGSWHEIAFSSLVNADVDAVIQEQVRHYLGLNAEVEWKVYSHDRPPDLRHRLERHGFAIGDKEVVVALDLRQPPSWINSPPPHRVVRVTTLEQLETYRTISESAFGQPQSATMSALTTAISSGSSQHRAYLGFNGEVPACAARLDAHPDSAFGGLYGGGTLAEHRGLGLYRAVIAARARDALALGVRYLIVDALPTSQPILERLGFVRITETWPCKLSPRPR